MSHFSFAQAITRKLQVISDQELKATTLTDLEIVHQYRGSTDPAVLQLSNRLVKNHYETELLRDEAEDAAGFQRRINQLEHELNKEETEHVATKKELESYRRVYG